MQLNPASIYCLGLYNINLSERSLFFLPHRSFLVWVCLGILISFGIGMHINWSKGSFQIFDHHSMHVNSSDYVFHWAKGLQATRAGY